MPVLRDIVARLGLDLDKKGFKEGDKAVGGIKGALGSLVSAATLAAGAIGAIKLTELASDANETLNVLSASFGDNLDAVNQWAAGFATDAGRSEFGMREMAGTLGAVLNPLMERNQDAAAEMSTGLAELAVDLGSFFNAMDQDALEALRSGVVGEAEPLKRFGIVMNEATLKAFALDQGIRKSLKSMSNAEKTQLRYNFIMDQTTLAQGDAAKTSEGWANATKGMTSSLKDLGTRLGLEILPFAERVVRGIRNLTRGFMEWQKGTNLLKGALIVLAAVGAKVAIGLLIAFAPVIIPILKLVAIFALLTLAVDDFLTFLDGGDSLIGRFIDSIYGPGSAVEAAENMKVAFKLLKEDVGLFFESLGEWIIVALDRLEKFKNTVVGVAKEVGRLFGMEFEEDKNPKRGETRPGPVRAPPKVTGPRRGETSVEGGKAFRAAMAERAKARAASIPAGAAAAAGGGSKSSKNTINQNVVVNMQGGSRGDADRAGKAAGKAVNKENRRTLAALKQLAE